MKKWEPPSIRREWNEWDDKVNAQDDWTEDTGSVRDRHDGCGAEQEMLTETDIAIL